MGYLDGWMSGGRVSTTNAQIPRRLSLDDVEILVA